MGVIARRVRTAQVSGTLMQAVGRDDNCVPYEKINIKFSAYLAPMSKLLPSRSTSLK